VSASPNHQTGRRLPLKFRFDVAMTGRLGIEMKPSDFTEEEKTFAKQAVSDYKRLRTVIQQGDLYRLISPYEGEGTAASLMYVAPDKQKAVFFAYKLKHFYDLDVPRFVFAGLDANKNYRLHEINKTDNNMKDLEGTVVSGRVLMNTGIELPMNKEYSSRVIELTAE
jgi:alpha-galactosidase